MNFLMMFLKNNIKTPSTIVGAVIEEKETYPKVVLGRHWLMQLYIEITV